MDYQKMTKDELIEKLQEQKHLAEAVDAKDLELAKLKKANEENLVSKAQQHQKQIEQLTKDLNDIKRENIELKQKIQSQDAVTKQLEKYQFENKAMVSTLESYVYLVRNLMKNIQGGLDNAIELENILSKNFKKGGNLNG